MRIVLIGKDYIFKDNLPYNIIENYWISDQYQKKLINIKANNGKYEIISANSAQLLNSEYLQNIDGHLILSEANDNILENIILEENNVYPIQSSASKEVYLLYCLPDFQDNYIHLDIVGTSTITIGSSENNTIVYKGDFVDNSHCKIFKFNGKWTIENYSCTYGVFVNDFPVYNTTKNIFNGDIIFIMGLELVMIDESLYIARSKNNLFFDEKYFRLSKIKNSPIPESNGILYPPSNKTQYFSRAPRVIPPIETQKVKIDEPPQLSDEQQKPMLLLLGSSMAMGVMMFASLATTIQSLINGTAGAFETIVGLITSLAMLVAMLVLPILDVKWDKKSKKKYELKRQKKYTQYLNSKNAMINDIKLKQKQILFQNYLSTVECVKVILQKNYRLWERQIRDVDFLTVRLGLGDVPSQIDLSAPGEKFAMVDDSLINSLKDIISHSKIIEKAPVTVSLRKNRFSAIVSHDDAFTIKYMKNLILQLITFQSYEDLKLVFLLNNKNSHLWQFVKMLPYVWDDYSQIRFFADNYDDMNEISKYLLEILNNRLNSDSKETILFSPHYLIITDDYKQIENLNFVSELSKCKSDVGISFLCIANDLYSLPSDCKTFVDIKNSSNCILYENGINEENQVNVSIESLVTIFYEKIVEKLANISIRTKKMATSLPSNYNFLQMYNVGNIEQLNVLRRWKENDSTLSLKAPIGIDSNEMIINLDVHEKFHGPHGLIAGSTGSGKSEFIITYILSLALNYHPNDVSFLLIDYKGGGLAGAFKKNNIKLPHLVGTITNIDKFELKRSLTSIQSELKRRQIAFNEARNMTNEGTIDIYKYQKLYHDGIVKAPISHLFIICDEFAELKQQQPDFMEELVSVSRIGRSLGVHLILATQKPSGVVDDEIRSNSRFAICLKVQNTMDSQDVISCSDAAFLKNAGQFYLKVGQNEYFTLGQSGWTGAPYIPSDVPKKKLDTSVEFVSNIGLPIKTVNDNTQNISDSYGEQLTNILSYICDLANKENIKTNNLWLDNIPPDIYLKDLKEKYSIRLTNQVSALIGEYDDPSNQMQGPVEFNLSKRENAIIYGNAESGKETLLSTFVYDLITTYSPSQVQIYILDFGSEALKIYKNSPHVGDVIFMGQDEKLEVFFEMIQRNIKERKEILSNYNGDYNLYMQKQNNMPIITIIINNYESFNENYGDKYDDLFLALTREGSKCGIVFIVTASTTGIMRYRLNANFNKKIALQLNNDDDFYSLFDKIGEKRPTHIFGRGLTLINNNILEFQTAKICDAVNYSDHIGQVISQLNTKYTERAVAVPTLPKKLEVADMTPYLNSITKVPIGLIKKNLDVYTYDFVKNFTTVISSKKISDAIEFSRISS